MAKLEESLPHTAYVEPLDAPSEPLIAAMAALFAQGQGPHHDAFPDHFGPASNRTEIEGYLRSFLEPQNPLREWLKGRQGYAKGWFVDGALAGYLLYRLHRSSNVFYGQERWTCFVEDIVVDTAARGMGGASALLGAVLSEAGNHKNCVISGTVWNGNSASEALFGKHGFEPLSRTFYKVSS